MSRKETKERKKDVKLHKKIVSEVKEYHRKNKQKYNYESENQHA